MLLVTVNAAFGAGFLFFAMNAIRRGWPFVRHGWLTIQTQTADPNFRQDVHRRRAIGEGGRFLVGGLLWLGAALGSGAAGIYFTIQALQMLNGQN